ncbi:XRE family transcriptional regulator [Eubacterium sp. am_0171]|uniref:Predicted transcriptional regulator n=1 Tax=Faecalicatena contorta TaxID=39482 RepID=A0A174BW35_9FIRM|nr:MULTISPECIES: helix-turn-helix transcriptional regulator [Clostridia]MSC83205.1 helix-turn-helix domain-containing protein [Eubacterium sp. BIOML-A1]MSD05693.1 helix-turn-helix domain-containing protein [Eubacterium sp. BIOML-A2]RYT24586.1 XRE family transcriptional regulator [Eubacterium sp. am_0171]CUO03860.1 Predicted transcriptional regulator [[Eubacterium] contortum] [Faecalicatena contorta]
MISYEPLFQTMKRKNISTYELEKRGFSRSNYSMKKGESVSAHTINKLCAILECDVSDIMEFIVEPIK